MIATLYVKRNGSDPEARILLSRLNKEGFSSLKDLFIEKVFRFEGISVQETMELSSLLCHPGSESMSVSHRVRSDEIVSRPVGIGALCA